MKPQDIEIPEISTDTTGQSETPAGISRRMMLGGVAGFATAIPGFAAVAAGLHSDDDHDDDGHNAAGDDHDDDDSHDDDDGHDEDHDDDHDDDDDGGARILDDGSVEVRITDDDADGFTPGELTITAGQSVTFVNRDDEPHTATGGSWDTGTLEPGDSAIITFDTAGEFAYSCQFHPVMSGAIVVEGAMASPQASPAASRDAIRIVEFDYDPPQLEVATGTTVTWTNEDQVPHTATSSDGLFDTGTIGAGESAEVTFDEAGTFEYVCAFHAGMRATIVVS